MTIRPATPADVPAVLPMVAKISAFHEALDAAKYAVLAKPEERYRSWMTGRAKDPRSVFLIADAAAAGSPANLVAFLVGAIESEIPIYRVTEYGFIYDLWVEEGYRNEGLARQLVTLAVERFRELGVKQVRLDTAYHNEPAKGLFQSCGFRPSIIEWLIET